MFSSSSHILQYYTVLCAYIDNNIKLIKWSCRYTSLCFPIFMTPFKFTGSYSINIFNWLFEKINVLNFEKIHVLNFLFLTSAPHWLVEDNKLCIPFWFCIQLGWLKCSLERYLARQGMTIKNLNPDSSQFVSKHLLGYSYNLFIHLFSFHFVS